MSKIINDSVSVKKGNSTYLLLLVFLLLSNITYAADLKGTVNSSDGQPLCALAIASGQSTFTCDPIGQFFFRDLPLEPDGTIKLQVYADGFFPNVTRLNDFGPQQVVLERAACGGGDGGSSTNKQKTEKMIGSWDFVYTIIDTWTDSFRFSGPAVPYDSEPGDYIMTGTDKWGNPDVAVTYNSSKSEYFLVNIGSIIIDEAFSFNFTSSNNVSGCYYQVQKSDGSIGRCYPMNGYRTGSAVSSNSTPVHKIATNEIDMQSRKVNEAEVQFLAQSGLMTSLVETKEDVEKREEVQRKFEILREAIEAR